MLKIFVLCIIYFKHLHNRTLGFLILVFFLFQAGNFSKNDKAHPSKKIIEPVFELQTNPISKKLSYHFDTFFTNRVKSCHLSGVVLIAKGNKIFHKAYGETGLLNSKLIDKTDVFEIASVSKFITALCISALIEEKKLRYEDSIEQFFPNFTYKGITIHHLLSHQSGLPEYMYLTDTRWKDSTLNNIQAVNLLSKCDIPAYFRPGQRYNYCNSNYMILAAIAENATSKPFYEIIKDQLALPLGLDSLHAYNEAKRPLMQYSVKGMRGNHTIIPNHVLNQVLGDKGIKTNTFDLFKICRGFMANKMVSAESKKRMIDSAVRVNSKQNYGYGLRSIALNNGEIWHYHNGWWHGFRSYFWFNEEKEECVIVITNRLKCGFLNMRSIIDIMELHGQKE